MEGLSGSELLFYGGIAAMAVTAVVSIVTAVILRVSGKCLRERLEEEFGEKRH